MKSDMIFEFAPIFHVEAMHVFMRHSYYQILAQTRHETIFPSRPYAQLETKLVQVTFPANSSAFSKLSSR